MSSVSIQEELLNEVNKEIEALNKKKVELPHGHIFDTEKLKIWTGEFVTMTNKYNRFRRSHEFREYHGLINNSIVGDVMEDLIYSGRETRKLFEKYFRGQEEYSWPDADYYIDQFLSDFIALSKFLSVDDLEDPTPNSPKPKPGHQIKLPQKRGTQQETLPKIVAIDHGKFLRNLIKYFSLSELKTLCMDLDVTYESLDEGGIEDKARALISYMERHGRFQEFLGHLSIVRPHVRWEKFIKREKLS